VAFPFRLKATKIKSFFCFSFLLGETLSGFPKSTSSLFLTFFGFEDSVFFGKFDPCLEKFRLFFFPFFRVARSTASLGDWVFFSSAPYFASDGFVIFKHVFCPAY